MTFCTLEMAGRMVLRSEGGFPEAEYALFDAAEIELRALEIGIIREAGYRTTVGDALERLAALGITPQTSENAAAVLRASAEKLYSRGASIERAMPLLGAAELFDGFLYDASTHQYEGLWLDHAALARDLGLAGAGAILQAMALAAMLHECPYDAEVVLTTIEVMKGRRPGERSYRRIAFRDAPQVAGAIAALSGAPSSREPRRARSVLELVQSLREREISPERFAKIEQAIASPRPPPRGPLADPAIWAIDAALAAGTTEGALAGIEAIEKSSGRQPATIYLRCRVALALGSEAPRVIAQRLEELAMSQTFPELEVLVAQAWLGAGDSARALPFARSAAENPAVMGKLREIAEDIVAAIPHPGSVFSAAPPRHSGAPRHSVAPDSGGRAGPLGGGARKTVPPPFGAPGVDSGGGPGSSATAERDAAAIGGNFASFDLEWAGVDSPNAPAKTVAPAVTATARPPAPSLTPPPRPELSELETTPVAPSSSASPVADTAPPPRTREPSFATGARPLMKGASQPAFRSDFPAADFPRAAGLPRFEPPLPELAESLSLPPGLSGPLAPTDALPASIAEARLQFTGLARDLGRDYHERFGLELWTDLRGIETMQTVLREEFEGKTITEPSQTLSIRRHGAFLSEVIARTLGAEWTDIAPSELGYWAMIVPPSTRVWPFGRVLRLIAMGTKERDLVSYYLELQARAQRRQ